MKKLVFLIGLFALSTNILAQDRPKQNPREKDLIFWGYPDNYLENQARESFLTINQTLQVFPPCVQNNEARNMALMALDQLLHDSRNDKTEAFYSFLNMRMETMLQELRKPVKEGVKIFKLYNDGFIMKTQSATIAIDLVPGGSESRPFIADSTIMAIANECDAMFISHAHGDHANLRIAKAFANSQKTIIVPKGLWTEVDPYIQQLLVADTAVVVPFDELGVQVKILPGHQDDMYNNIYVIYFKEGYSVAHTGDQWNLEDLNWIDSVYKHDKIDILIPNCWINSLQRSIKGFSPKLVITGHENEMEHSIDHRESYWMTRRKMESVPTPNVLMTWGESFLYKK